MNKNDRQLKAELRAIRSNLQLLTSRHRYDNSTNAGNNSYDLSHFFGRMLFIVFFLAFLVIIFLAFHYLNKLFFDLTGIDGFHVSLFLCFVELSFIVLVFHTVRQFVKFYKKRKMSDEKQENNKVK